MDAEVFRFPIIIGSLWAVFNFATFVGTLCDINKTDKTRMGKGTETV